MPRTYCNTGQSASDFWYCYPIESCLTLTNCMCRVCCSNNKDLPWLQIGNLETFKSQYISNLWFTIVLCITCLLLFLHYICCGSFVHFRAFKCISTWIYPFKSSLYFRVYIRFQYKTFPYQVKFLQEVSLPDSPGWECFLGTGLKQVDFDQIRTSKYLRNQHEKHTKKYNLVCSLLPIIPSQH